MENFLVEVNEGKDYVICSGRTNCLANVDVYALVLHPPFVLICQNKFGQKQKEGIMDREFPDLL